jgi:uncharacterized protein
MNNMQIQKGIEITDLCLYIKKHKLLVIGDVHIGYEEELNKKGYLIPRIHYKETMQRLEKIVKEKDIETILFIGDLKHEFGTISETEWRNTLKLLDFCAKHCNKIILIKGNHDTILEPIAKKRKLEVVDEFIVDNILFLHGNIIPKHTLETIKDIKTIIIGHEHPAISIIDPPRVERYKCFLKGKYKNKQLIVLPSFNLITEGTDILKEQLLSPFLKQNLNNFEVFIVADKVYSFGKIKKIKEINKKSS